MPMFDDPKKELNRLQKELLAQEEPNWDDELADLDALLADYEEERNETVENEYEQVDDLHRMSNILLEEEEDSGFYQDEEQKGKKPRQKGVIGLVVVACLETVAIIGLLAWWFLCLR